MQYVCMISTAVKYIYIYLTADFLPHLLQAEIFALKLLKAWFKPGCVVLQETDTKQLKDETSVRNRYCKLHAL